MVPTLPTAIPRVRHYPGRPAPLSAAQQRLWFLQRLRPQSTEYNLQLAFRARGPLSLDALARALAGIVERHEPLRTVVAVGSTGEPVQVVRPASEVPLVRRPQPPGDYPQERAAALVDYELSRPFDVAAEPPMRACVAPVGPGEHVVVVTMHHIAFDGWSTGIMLRELAQGYADALGGHGTALAAPATSYADYVWWEREVLDLVGDAQVQWWRDTLAGVEELDLPTDRPGPGPGGMAGRIRLDAHPDTVARATRLAMTERTTGFTVGLAAVAGLLRRYCDPGDFCLAVPAMGRPDIAFEPIIGCFVNTVLLRMDGGGRPTFRDLVRAQQSRLADAIAHQLVPFDRIVRELAPARRRDANPIFRVFCGAFDGTAGFLELTGLECVPVIAGQPVSKFDLGISFTTGSRAFAVDIEYSQAIFDGDTVARMGHHLMVLLDWALAQPDLPVDEIPLLVPAERAEILTVLNGG